jgi:predicted GIY-YIG superfamily endonuclease
MSTDSFVLYRFFDANGVLLYIGATSNFANRAAHHAARQPWWTDVTDIKVEHLESREALLAAEKDAIDIEGPLHNVIYGSAPTPWLTKPRGPRGEGTVFRRRDGVWVGRVELPSREGKRRYKYVSSRDHATVLQKFDQLKADLNGG